MYQCGCMSVCVKGEGEGTESGWVGGRHRERGGGGGAGKERVCVEAGRENFWVGVGGCVRERE